MTSDNNEKFPDDFHVSTDQDQVDYKFLSGMPPFMESVDSALDLVDSSPGFSQHGWFKPSHIQRNETFPDDPDHVARRDSQDGSAPRTSYSEPDKIADGLPEISERIPSLNHGQLLRLKAHLEAVLQRVDDRLQIVLGARDIPWRGILHSGNVILSHGVDKKPDHSLAPGGTEPQEPIVHEPRRSSLSHGSGSAAYSVATDITTLESEEDSIDAGIPDTKNMDHILDAARYFSELDQLELQTAQRLGMLNGTRIKLDSLDDCIECLGNWQAALEYLQSQGFCGNTISILIEDQDRDGVASAFHISLGQVGALLETILSTLEEGALKGSAMAWMQTMLNLDNNWLFDCDSVEILRYLCNILSIGIVSFSGSHVCRFDINLWDEEMEEIPVGFGGYAFKPRKLACLDDFIGGPAWILGKVSAPPEGMKISLTVQDIQELWGPVSLVEGTVDEAPIIQTERGFIIPLPIQ